MERILQVAHRLEQTRGIPWSAAGILLTDYSVSGLDLRAAEALIGQALDAGLGPYEVTELCRLTVVH